MIRQDQEEQFYIALQTAVKDCAMKISPQQSKAEMKRRNRRCHEYCF